MVRVSSRIADLTQADTLSQLNDTRFDQIHHLAAWTQAGDFCLTHAGEQWVINQLINTFVLSWWHAYQPRAKMVSMGSSCAYAPELELAEDNYFSGVPIDSLFAYAMTKRMLHAGQPALHNQFSQSYLTLVPSTLYGPGYHTDGRQMHFIFDLIRKIMKGRLHGDPVVLWGDGYQKRALVVLDDFVNFGQQLASRVDNDLINIGAGEEHTIRHFAHLICELVGYDFDAIQFDTARYVGARSKCLQTSKLRALMPDAHLTGLRPGLERTINLFWRERDQLLA